MTSSNGYSTDVVARCVFRELLKDFRVVHGQDFARGAEQALNTSISALRSYDWPKIGYVSPSRFKAWMQMKHLFKRHIFTDDVYTPKELEAITNQKYRENQEFFGTWKAGTPRTFAVLQKARSIAREILGKLDHDELASYVQIGRRATLGGPLQSSYLNSKMGDPRAFTCPTAARKWFFQDYLPKDPILKGVVAKVFSNRSKENLPIDLAADSLKLVNVPKSWKTLRSITPMSLIGLFLSYGIGGCVTARLRDHGLNIDRLQERHRRLARRFSDPRTKMSHVTADLSSASDSIMSHHLNAVLPREWYTMLRKTFVRQVVLSDNKGVSSATFSILPMGNGATFPVETLYFYCLIRAIGSLLNVKGTYSVYGDDLIYPSKIHTYVLRVFGELGIRINEDKTFVDSYFRESCGGDYYRACDVRPALLPENRQHELKGKQYAAYLYKVANALRARWDDTEIRYTLNFIKAELAYVTKHIYLVPQHFPDTSGWKTDALVGFEKHLPWCYPRRHFRHGQVMIKFQYLTAKSPGDRWVDHEVVYIWESLRQANLRPQKQYLWWPSLLPRQIPSTVHLAGTQTPFLRRRIKDGSEEVLKVAEPSKEDTSSSYKVVSEWVPSCFWV